MLDPQRSHGASSSTSTAREDFRAKVHAAQAAPQNGAARREPGGLIFRGRVTVRYQVQEMLRIERIFEEEGIRGRTRRLQSADPGRRATGRRR